MIPWRVLAIVPIGVALYCIALWIYLRGQISVSTGRERGLIGKEVPDGPPLASTLGPMGIGFLKYHGARLDIYERHLAFHRYGFDDRLADPIVISSESIGRVAIERKTGERLRLFDPSGTRYALTSGQPIQSFSDAPSIGPRSEDGSAGRRSVLG